MSERTNFAVLMPPKPVWKGRFRRRELIGLEVAGRLHAGSLRKGDRLLAVSTWKSGSDVTPVQGVYVEVVSIAWYGHLVDELDLDHSALLTLAGIGLQHILDGMALVGSKTTFD